MFHSFNVKLAVQYGTEEAVLLQHLYYWLQKNRANNTNFHEGKHWTYNSVRAFVEIFPYIPKSTLARKLQKLETEGLIVSGNHNKSKMDRTSWYAFTEKGWSLFEDNEKCISQDGTHIPRDETHISRDGTHIPQDGVTIPNINTDINTNINTDINTDTNNPPTPLLLSQTGNAEGGEEIKTETAIKKPKAKADKISELKAIRKEFIFAPELDNAVKTWLMYKYEKGVRHRYTPTGLRMLLNKIQKNANEYGDTTVVELINDSIASNYMGIVWDKIRASPNYGNTRASPNQERSENGTHSTDTANDTNEGITVTWGKGARFNENGILVRVRD